MRPSDYTAQAELKVLAHSEECREITNEVTNSTRVWARETLYEASYENLYQDVEDRSDNYEEIETNFEQEETLVLIDISTGVILGGLLLLVWFFFLFFCYVFRVFRCCPRERNKPNVMVKVSVVVILLIVTVLMIVFTALYTDWSVWILDGVTTMSCGMLVFVDNVVSGGDTASAHGFLGIIPFLELFEQISDDFNCDSAFIQDLSSNITNLNGLDQAQAAVYDVLSMSEEWVLQYERALGKFSTSTSVGDNPDSDWTDCWYTDATLTSMDCPDNNDQTPIVFGLITECSEGAEICESKFEEVANKFEDFCFFLITINSIMSIAIGCLFFAMKKSVDYQKNKTALQSNRLPHNRRFPKQYRKYFLHDFLVFHIHNYHHHNDDHLLFYPSNGWGHAFGECFSVWTDIEVHNQRNPKYFDNSGRT